MSTTTYVFVSNNLNNSLGGKEEKDVLIVHTTADSPKQAVEKKVGDMGYKVAAISDLIGTTRDKIKSLNLGRCDN